ncbi:MAG: PEP-utilizing protein mobile region [Anaerolineales bacterium]|nr:PEP-utilizing protein mobile region [Anaerolineales bacterium]
MASANGRFPSPFEVPTPEGCEGWKELYPYYYVFSDDRREFEDNRFWFQDGMHHPEPLYPFDTITSESWWVALGQYNTRVFVVPPALGIDQRVLNGYLYITALPVANPNDIPARVGEFMERAGYYYQNWDRLYAQWVKKAEETIAELKAIKVPDLPEREDLETVVKQGRGITSAYDLLTAYNRAIENMHKIWHLHFEFLNLGYAAYLTFYGFCKQTFPDIPDQTVAKLVSGIDVILFRPDEELKRLAKAAVDMGVAGVFKKTINPDKVIAEMGKSDAGKKWLAELEKSKDPWFYFSTGTGFYHLHRSWIDDMTVPCLAIRGYIEKIEKGETIARPMAEIRKERDRLAAEYTALLPTDEAKKAFQEQLGLARTVFPYVENHNFYVEHWHHTVFWNKMREFGRLLVKHGFFKEVDDMFYLHRFEVQQAIYDLIGAWGSGGEARGPKYWPPIVAKRKVLFEKLKKWAPPPALGEPPEVVTEPFTIMLWGITTDSIQTWLKPKEEGAKELKGFAGSPGVVEGPARVITSVEELVNVQPGEILVCPITTPSWAPIFNRIKATVTDIGGMMSHAAIVCREYGLPAVVGTGYGTKTFKNGQMLRVDGSTGVVTALN